MNSEIHKLPRLFVTAKLNQNDVIAFDESQAHYLNNVMRRKNGDYLRVFNGTDGEWVGILQNAKKKQAELLLQEQITEQIHPPHKRALCFAPIKKTPMAWMIEKAVELGVTDLQPVTTQNTQNKALKPERIMAQIVEASEQCERLTLPTLHEAIDIGALLEHHHDCTLLTALERTENSQNLQDIDKNQDLTILIGPEGGFTEEERNLLQQKTTPITLGDNILRAETAAIKSLAILS